MSLRMEDVRKHPMFLLLSTQLGEKEAERIVKQKLEEIEKENQSETEFSDTVKKIIIPNSMNKIQASKELKRQWDDEENIINVDRGFENWNWKDVLVAVKKAAERHFGWVQGVTTYSFFGGKQRPKEIEILTDIVDGKKITETCFYGTFAASVWEDANVTVKAQYISAEVKKRYANDVRQFFDLVQEILDKESIYRGKAITVTKQVDPWGEVSLDFDIFQMKVSDKIILNEDIETVVKNFIIDDLGDEGKRCYLFSGGYGNGKTETAMRVGRAGLDKAMAYFYCKDASVFHMLLAQAKNYQPAIVFLEDVDEIGSGEKRDADMNRILNTLDGVQTKGNNLTVIFTTNHEKRINPALRRPGRIDLVVNFGNPDKVAVASIYKSYLGELPNAEKLDYKQLADRTPDCQGAVIAEIAKRALKLCKKRGDVNDELIKASIDSMKHHLALMQDKVEEPSSGEMVIMLKGANMVTKDLNGEKKVLEQAVSKI
jgi:AAA+ superfamily predicted ATPase